MYAETDCHDPPRSPFVGYGEGFDLTPYPLSGNQRTFEISVWQDKRKLLSSDPCGKIPYAASGAQDRCDPLEASVSGRMAVDVVELLEVVDIQHHERERLERSPGACPLRSKSFVERATVRQARQAVRCREPGELLVGPREPDIDVTDTLLLEDEGEDGDEGFRSTRFLPPSRDERDR